MKRTLNSYITEQIQWIRSCGGNREGYRLNYAGNPDVNADDIYHADMAALEKLVARMEAGHRHL